MKAIDDITWNDTDTYVAAAELDFAYDAAPLVAGELGAGIFAPAEDEPELIDDSGFFDWM